ncbi:alpha/beta fold hydrolase [soil metagenome]
MPVTHLLYLHGFRSSPQSSKARRMAEWVQASGSGIAWWCPQLPPSPREAMALVEAGIADWPEAGMAVIGSSLGGFYATAVAEKHGCPAVLLNPAVDPARDLAKHIGATTAWHSDEAFYFKPEYIDELKAIRPDVLTLPGRYFAVIAKGDEVLDWREMSQRYSGGPQLILEGSDHALSEFDDQLPEVVRFLGLA